jgi:hypothetical protein
MHADSLHAYNGMCLAYIRARKPGHIKLKVSGDGVAPKSFNIEAIT